MTSLGSFPDYVTRRFNASSAELKCPRRLDLRWTPLNAISTSNWDLVSWPNRKPKIDNVGFEFWPLFLGVTEPEAELVVQPNKSAPAAKKPAKVRKRPAKKGPPAPAERER